MRYRVLGPSGIRVGELALGTRTFGTAWEWGADKAECGRMLEAFVEARLTVTSHLTLDGVMQSNGEPEPELNDSFEQGGWQVPYFDQEWTGSQQTGSPQPTSSANRASSSPSDSPRSRRWRPGSRSSPPASAAHRSS